MYALAYATCSLIAEVPLTRLLIKGAAGFWKIGCGLAWVLGCVQL
jgi:hypothetical protein